MASSGMQELFEAQFDDEAFFLCRREELLAGHLGEHVVIRQRKILGFFKTVPELRAFLKDKVGKNRAFVVQITPEAFEPDKPTVLLG